MEIQASVLEVLAISDVVYGSLANGLGIRAKVTSSITMYTHTMGVGRLCFISLLRH